MKTRYFSLALFLFLKMTVLSAQTINIHAVSYARQLTGNNGYTLDGSEMTLTRFKLLHPSNFSDTGIYKKNIDITSGYFLSNSLTKIGKVGSNDMFFFGTFYGDNTGFTRFTKAEIDSLYNWSLRGGKMIIAEQKSSDNTTVVENLGEKWGYEIKHLTSSEIIPTEIGQRTKIFNGPFGIVNKANQSGTAQGCFEKTPSNSIVLGTDNRGNSTLILDCNTMDLIATDTDVFGNLGGLSVSYEIENDQDRFLANTIAFMDSLGDFPEPVVSFNGTSLATGDYYAYKWLYNLTEVKGADNAQFIPDRNGYYSVIVQSEIGCIDTSDVFLFGTQDEPAIGCPSHVIIPTDPGLDYAANTLPVPMVYDIDGIDTIYSNAPEIFPMGQTEVTWEVVDMLGYKSTCMQNITVVDQEPPIIDCSTLFIGTDSGKNYATTIPEYPVVTDNHKLTEFYHEASFPLAIGDSWVTWFATDSSGNASSCSTRVVVRDREKPVIICQPDTIVYIGKENSEISIELKRPISQDNFGILNQYNNAPARFPIGTTYVTWTVVDFSSNESSCVQTVHVIDTVKPVISCPDNIVLDLNEYGDFTISLEEPEVYDNSNEVSVSNNAPFPFPVGVTTVKWTVKDNSGNTSECEQEIAIVDFAKLFIPNIFTPNADGINDHFIIENIPNGSELLVFDRMNNIVYRSENYQNDWNGTDGKGNTLREGTYWYVLKVPRKQYSGFVVINRD